MLPTILSAENPASRSRRGSWLLLAVTAACAAVWLVVLPRLAELQAVRETIDRNERLGINPAAKFYTELPCMPAVFYEVDRALHCKQPAGAYRASSPSPSGRGPG